MKIIIYIAILALTTSFVFKGQKSENTHRSLETPEVQQDVVKK